MNIVIDCNVLIAAGLKNGLCRTILKDIVKHHILFASEEIFLEYLQVAGREKFKESYSVLKDLIIALADVAIIIKPKPCPYKLPDIHDQKYLAVALTSGAEVIVTGNEKDFPEGAYRATRIITPHMFYISAF